MVKDCSSDAPTSHNLKPLVTKNKQTEKEWMISSNNNKYVLKCYLKFFKIVPVKMEGAWLFIALAMLRYTQVTHNLENF